MKNRERRAAIAAWLLAAGAPVAGDDIAARFDVSRQTVVKDIATLRETGHEIRSTHTGYLLERSPLAERVFKVKHTSEQTADELSTIVAEGASVTDVFVWHKVYGKLTAPLRVYSQTDVDEFVREVNKGTSAELMSLTEGLHYHTVCAETEEILDKIAEKLAAKGYLVPDQG